MTFPQDNRPKTDGVVALVGNPNTGKSTIFNALTGLKQHTGNWPGKTVSIARGTFRVGAQKYLLVDLPGTYSLRAGSPEEKITRDFLLSGRPHVTVVVADAGRLERNLYLVLQVLEITGKVVVCLNMLDDARRRGICVDVRALEEELGVPVVAAAARQGLGLQELKGKIDALARGEISVCPRRVKYDPDIEEQLAFMSGTRWLALEALLGQQKPGEGSWVERFKYCPV
ncbi:FeoB small GTPase domain-containing protein [Desulfovirgula thermocuniculi]|uniref:FeoB small GTPase domain-containing protein n=1 Tax=Desulfovirgula thermocuniculi TaxID=348842 RepID=UPI00040605E8|nr:FeoB small GTPase domain-containing protein [Desulfovirgula thermocuniculi]